MINYGISARKYTDEEYLAKIDLVSRVGSLEVERLWKAIGEYRENYRYSLSIKRTNSLPFTVCLTPAILTYASECEKRMLQFSILFERLKNLEVSSKEKVLTDYKKTVTTQDLLTIAKKFNISYNKKDIELTISSEVNKSSIVYGIYQALQMIQSDRKYTSVQDMIDINALITRQPKETSKRTEQLLNQLTEFLNKTEGFSTFVVASFIYGFFLYNQPFSSQNDLTGLLIALKEIRDSGYAESIYYTGILSKVFIKYNAFQSALNNCQLYGDLTYVFITFCETFLDAIDEQYDQLSSIKEPIPEEKEVKYVTKEVVKEVEKIVYVDKTEKKNPQEKKEEVIKNEEEIDDIFKEEPVVEEKEMYQKSGSSYNFAKDPFSKPITPDSKKVTVKSVNVPQAQYLNVEIDMLPIAKENKDKEENEFANALMHANPFMKFNQAHFYAQHHEKGEYYTIRQFKEFSGCVYETARTSMDYLASLNLYKKQQIKNKFVYVAISLED